MLKQKFWEKNRFIELN